MSKKALYIRHKAQPGKREEVKRIWEKYARAYIEDADGQIAYVYGFDDTDPDAIVAYQFYDGEAGKEDFVKQPWYPDYERETAALLAGPSEFRTITPQWIKGGAA
ncbi:putative quinol monooxygenase [Nitratireductor sp. GCM10026969]|uniref:putative quinol monooxygenase n=1 Tax=Nitratireductor sp. GCM10026969 TaxID=3252645 RepID=UPI0036160101